MDALALHVPAAIDDATIEAEKAGNRAILLRRLEWQIAMCDEELGIDTAGERDIRWAELRLRTLDRVARILRLEKPAIVAPDEPDADPVVDRARKIERLAASFDGEG